MNRAKLLESALILALAINACAGSTSTPQPSTATDLPQVNFSVSTMASAGEPDLTPTSALVNTVQPNTIATNAAQASPIPNTTTLIPTAYPSAAPTEDPLKAIHPDRSGKIELLSSLETSTYGRIYAVTWRPGTKNLLVQSARNLFLLDPIDGRIFWELPSGYKEAFFNEDGTELIALHTNEIQHIDPSSGLILSSTPVAVPEGMFLLSPDGVFIAGTTGGEIKLTNLQTGQSLILPVDHNSGPISDLTFSADNRWVIAGSQNGDIQAWDARSGLRTLFQPASMTVPVYECQSGGMRNDQPPGALIMVCSYPAENNQAAAYRVDVYDASANTAYSRIIVSDTDSRGYHTFVVSADKSRLAAIAEGNIEIWNTSSSSRVRILKDASGAGMVFNPEEKSQLAVWSQYKIDIWDTNTGQKVQSWIMPEAAEPLTHLAFSPSPGPRQLVLARSNGQLELWDLTSLKKTADWQAATSVTALAFSADNTNLAVGHESGIVSLFDLTAVDFVPQTEFQAGFAVNALVFAEKDPALLYVAGESHHVHLWNVNQKVESGTLLGSNLFELTTIHLQSGILAAGTEPGRIVLWPDTPGAAPFTELAFSDMSPILALFIIPDGSQVMFTQGNDLKIWNIQTRKRVRETFFKYTDSITALLTPDGCTIAVQTRDSLKLLNSSTFEIYADLQYPAQLINALAISTDGIILASGAEDGSLLLWGETGALQIPNGTAPALNCRSIPPPAPTPTASATPRPSATPILTATPLVTATFTPTPPLFTRSLKLTDPYTRGDDVFLLQQRLSELGYAEVGTPDGVFGKMTDTAVRNFQQNNGLDADGIVGPVTWKVIFSASAR